MLKNCLVCNKEFKADRKERKYCNHSCAAKNTKNFLGHKHSPESLKKISESKLKNPIRYWLGKTKSAEIRKRISEGHIAYDDITNKGWVTRRANKGGVGLFY